MPCFNSIADAPATRFLTPSRTIASANTVAVVVPSPAASLVLLATSRRSSAPIFSYGSGSWTSFATVTPSLVIVGGPHFLSRTAFLPLGPKVALTADDNWLTPRRRRRGPRFRTAGSLQPYSFLHGFI